MTPEPINKTDVKKLIDLGDALAKQLNALADNNMKSHAKKLLTLQWWESAQEKVRLWEQYVRFMKRDNVV